MSTAAIVARARRVLAGLALTRRVLTRRVLTRRALVLAMVPAVACGLSACSTVIAGSASPATAVQPQVAFTPYVDVSVRRPDLAAVAKATGLRHAVLAFVLAGPAGCEPAWGGTQPLDALKQDLAAFHAAGGEIVAATGGAQGQYLENACSTPAALAAAYGKIIDATGATQLDVDIETAVRADVVVAALAQLQQARGTAVTLTLPIDLGGLPPASLDLVKRAAAAHLKVTVNGMDMNFRTGGDWGQAMLDAAQAVLDQLRAVYPDASEAAQDRTLGLTIMIGRNDAGPVTTQADAKKVLDFARSRGLGRLGIWSLGRDTGACPGQTMAAPNCSGVAQADLEFTRMLSAFGN